MKKLIAVLALCLAGQVWAFDMAGWSKASDAKDYETAFAIAKAGAVGGDEIAQAITAQHYANGEGVTKDFKQAVYWYTKAAEQGDELSQYNLGLMYANGEGVTKNMESAYFWLLLAAVDGDADAVKNRDIAEKQLTPEQQGRAQAKASAWKPKK
jgi:TPR repeat protein